MNFWLFSIPFVSASIGWVANRVAIKMLFHPRLPIKLPGITLHGFFPKKQRQLAEEVGKIISTELSSFEGLEQKIANPENLKKIMPFIERHIDHFLREKLGERMPMLKMFIGDKIIEQLKEVFMEELELLFPSIMRTYISNFKSDLNIDALVMTKFSNFSNHKLEPMVHKILKNEFKRFETYGAIIGFAIGSAQIFITILAS